VSALRGIHRTLRMHFIALCVPALSIVAHGTTQDLYAASKGDSDDLLQYGIGIGQLLAPGLVLALFTLIGGIIYGCIRCCKGCGCCKCCSCCRQSNRKSVCFAMGTALQSFM